MGSKPDKPTNIEEYIVQFPDHVQEILQKIRKTIRETAPEAREAISYQIPTFKLKEILVHFAAYKNHIGFYPTPSGILKFEKELSGYQTSKGTIKFPLDQPIPYDLIRMIVIFRVRETLEKAGAKENKKKANRRN
jgi:uncharacterized protein YdhG (YjbR/CyaY superfamily)